MFSGLRETIKALNADCHSAASSQKAKALRKKLFSIGIPLAVIGYLGVFVCFALFAVLAFKGIMPMLPFVLFLPCGFVGAIGTSLIGLALKIVIVDYTTGVISDAVGGTCPNCGDTIEGSEIYCDKCGAKLRKTCDHCGTVNEIGSAFCKKCGAKLDD